MKTGDAIYTIANPIAKGIDAIWGSDLAGCSGCNKMRENLNSGMGFWEAVKQRFQQQTEGENMQFQVQVVVEAESVIQAITPEFFTKGTVISVTPRPPQPVRPANLPATQHPGIAGKVG